MSIRYFQQYFEIDVIFNRTNPKANITLSGKKRRLLTKKLQRKETRDNQMEGTKLKKNLFDKHQITYVYSTGLAHINMVFLPFNLHPFYMAQEFYHNVRNS